jgi:hypothetical protein
MYPIFIIRLGNKKGIDAIENIPEELRGEPYLIYQLAQLYREVGEDKDKILSTLEDAQQKPLIYEIRS